ncbi:MAG TPA: endolytic transglycosylase MltG [Thermoanaerobacterales bacterium]|nr:endolytic transglycosylase MltG [Thermoanaerobacterales bacterium]
MNYKIIWQRFLESTAYLILKKHIIIVISLVFMLGLLFFTVSWYCFMLYPKDKTSDIFVEFEVESGSTAEEMAQKMYKIGLIKNPLAFNLYARIKGYDVKIKSGTYMLGPSMSADEMLKKMVSGDTLKKEQRITIPEGVTLEKIAEIFQKHNLLSKEEFLKVAKAAYFKGKYKFLESLPSDATLEGFLFPDTYFLSEGKSAYYYIDILLKRFNEIYFGKGYDLQQQKNGLTISQVVTLASIIEAEAKVASEKPVISSVFHNRMKKGMALQSCATVEYVLEEHKEVLTLKDLEIDSPYNTYKHTGLPPGPIGAPGISSIEAALNPADTDFLYFVSNGDGTHTFSKTYAEHLKNKNVQK